MLVTRRRVSAIRTADASEAATTKGSLALVYCTVADPRPLAAYPVELKMLSWYMSALSDGKL